MSAENDEEQPAAARPRFGTAEARQKAEFILSRAYGLFRNPKLEWEQIRDEKTSVLAIVLGYVAPLAAIPPLCDLIGSILFNRALLFADPGGSIVRAATTWLVSVALVFLLGLLIDALAESFDGERDDLAAQKVPAYAMTPVFLSGLFSLWPPAWWLSLLAIAYAVFLFYRGLPTLMKAPEERAVGYAATVVIAGLVAFIVLFSVSACVAGAGRV